MKLIEIIEVKVMKLIEIIEVKVNNRKDPRTASSSGPTSILRLCCQTINKKR